MKKIKLFITILFSIFLLSGCAYDRGLILFNNVPITQSNALHDRKTFPQGSRVYFLFIAPKKMTNDLIRVQVFKMTDFDEGEGNMVVRTKDYRLMQDERYYYTDYFTFYQKGKYAMQVFSHDDFKNPIGANFFYIQ